MTKTGNFYVRCSTDGGETFGNVSRACPNPLSAMIIMRSKVRDMASKLIYDNKDFSLCQTNDSRWPDAWGYANNGYTIEYGSEKEKIIYEVVDAEDL